MMKNFWVKYVTCISYQGKLQWKYDLVYNILKKKYIENSLDFYMTSDIICNEGFEIK